MLVPRLRNPIVLVHGLFGFNRIGVGQLSVSYFPGIAEALAAGGNRVLQPSLSPTAGIARRAAQLKEFIDRECPREPVHIFGHSMGGLDSRYLIARLDMADRVLSLTTLGTPHRGSTFADWGTRFAPFYRPIFDILHLPCDGFADLTVAACKQFNELVTDAPGVRYFSVAGDFRRAWCDWQWEVSARVLDQVEGPNDGLVSVASARWGEALDVWDADHLNLANWPSSSRGLKNRIDHYYALVQRLVDAGF